MQTSYLGRRLRITAVGFTLVAGSCFLVACGSSTDGNGAAAGGGASGGGSAAGSSSSAPSSSGVDTGASAASLDDPQRNQLCEWYFALYTDPANRQAMCKRAALALASNETGVTLDDQRSKCSDAESTCLAKSVDQTAFLALCAPAFAADCTATVGEIESCLKDMFSAYRQGAASVPQCSALSADDLAAHAPLDVSSQACMAVAPKCPAFTKPEQQQPQDPPSVVACNEACAARNAQCASDIQCLCSIEYGVFYKELCAPFGKTYYDCAKQGTFDCSDDSLLSGSVECRAASLDYLTCFGNESADCVRVTAADSFCMNAALPTAYSCVSTSPQKAGCEQTAGAYYCCAK